MVLCHKVVSLFLFQPPRPSCLDREVQTLLWSLEFPSCRVAAETLRVPWLVGRQEVLTTLPKSC